MTKRVSPEMQVESTNPFADRAGFIANSFSPFTRSASYMSGGRRLDFVRDADGTAATTADGGTWSPAGDVFAKHFGAVEDYVLATDSGTNDLPAINAALAYLAAKDSRIAGGTVFIEGQSVVTGPINLPVGCYLEGVVSPSSSVNGQTLPSTFPITYRRSSAIIGSHTAGPVIRAQFGQSGARDLTIASTEARREATIGTADNWNGGILWAPPDTVGDSLMFYSQGIRLLVQDQPADGVAIIGHVTQYEMRDVEVLNCGRHGFVIDDGEGVGRVNKDIGRRPGIGRMINCRAENTGGHSLVIGNPNSSNRVPYRLLVDTFESFRAGNVPASLYISAACYCAAEDIIFTNCAVSGTSGTSGNVAALTYNYAIAGRDILFLSGRYIQAVTAPIRIMDYTGFGNSAIRFIGGYVSSNATPAPVNFVTIEAGCDMKMLQVDGITGNFTGEPVRRIGLDAAWSIQETYDETIWRWGFTSVTPTQDNTGFVSGITASIADNAATTIPIDLNGATAVYGQLVISGNVASARPSTVAFRVGSAAFATVLSGTATATTGVLSGTTGTDGDLTVSASGSTFYIENRTGASRVYGFTILSHVTVL